ncbi:MAG: hypothetical protein BWY17_05361 [Deltaproteobacteria bacterium ADurb.Bin207]|nr:MAG: hypothetical protein BWY17_05361 [Deltaproteobacteria bacterium ADurb.Bin207]
MIADRDTVITKRVEGPYACRPFRFIGGNRTLKHIPGIHQHNPPILLSQPSKDIDIAAENRRSFDMAMRVTRGYDR